ncbi:DUF4340 domain-containing protein [Thiohalocapsa sp. ML1]|uniref:DUF4340 domain-containing protein n=1 Tax=Thiohalocapsa sp. ML1 TaxID=1431688 RepID=UPI000731F8B0|nr:DUF4340 domain-containing protein [Thiohalocapsa sp. ML1]
MNDTTRAMPAGAARRRFGLHPDWAAALRTPVVILLAALLVVQLGLALVTGRDRGLAPTLAQAPLIGVDTAAVSEIEIESGDGERLLLQRRADGWVLPALSDFPVSGTRVEQLLGDLTGLERALPVATSAAAQRRFKVADDAFEQRLKLRANGNEAVLILGDSPGFRRTFVRVDGEDAVYDLRLGPFDLAAEPAGWIDRGRLQVDRGLIRRLQVAGADDGFALVRGAEGWALEGSNEAVDQDAADAFADAVATVGYNDVLLPDADLDYDLDAPAREISVTLDDGERRYRLAPIAESEDYVLRRDGEPHVYRLGAFDAELLLDTDRAGLLGEDEAPVAGAFTESVGDAAPAAEVPAAPTTEQ